MKSPSIIVALVASLVAAVAVAVNATPPGPLRGGAAPSAPALLAQAQDSNTYREGDRHERPRQRVQQQLRGTIADCHRDVRTHRINGEMVRHRHVGDDCAVRIVRQSSEPAPGG